MKFIVPVLLLAGLLLVAMPAVTTAAPPAQGPVTPPSVSGGAGLWAENCQPCHGPTGQGDGPSAQSIPTQLPDFSNPTTARQAKPIDHFNVIKNGRIDKLMPPWGNRLNEAQMWDLTAYVWRLGTTPQALTAGETLYQEQCAACHGPAGAGDGPQAPANIANLADLPAMVQLSQADLLSNYQAGEAHAGLKNMAEADLLQALDYVRTFTFAVPQRNGVLKGQVINGTTNEPVGNVEVTLRGFQGNAEVETQTVQADEKGNYTFNKVATEHTISYVVQGRYENIDYASSEPGAFAPDTTETTLDLPVYEPTTTSEAIAVTQMHYLMSFVPGTIQVAQVIILGNTGNQTYVGENGRTLTFAVPDNATGVSFENDPTGSRFTKVDEVTYADSEPITPGQRSQSIIAVYTIPFDGDAATINVPLPANVVALNVLMQDRGAKLASEQLQFADKREVQGDTFLIYNGTDLPKGQTVTLNLTGLSDLKAAPAGADTAAGSAMTAPEPAVDQNLIRWIVIGLGGLLIVAAAALYPTWRPQLTHQPGTHSSDPQRRREQLLLLLARLDEVYQAGELDDEVYQRARAKYKAELAEVMES